MAKIKIKEGSCTVWHVGMSDKKTTDKTHKKGATVRIEFVDYSTSYTFKEGLIVKADVKELAIH